MMSIFADHKDFITTVDSITMMNQETQEILINASLVTHNDYGEVYEFVLNNNLHVVESIRVDSVAQGAITPIENPSAELEGMLFELNHVRVNPRVDNSFIIETLTKALEKIGVGVSDSNSMDSLAVSYKPLGEISDNVRFNVDGNRKVIFMSPSVVPKLVSVSNPR